MSILQGVPGLAARIEASTGVLDRLAMEIAEHGEAAAAADYAEHWRSINDTAEAANMGGLSEVTEFIWFNAQRLVDACRDGSFEPEQVETLHGVVPMLQVFLAAPLDADGLGNLVCYLQQSGWPVPMGENQAYTVMGRLLEQLQEDEDAPAAAEQAVAGATGQPFSDDEASGEAVPGIGEPEDAGPAQEEDSGDEDEYRLGLPEDVHPQLADAFFNEVPQLAEQFSDHVQHLADGGDRDDLLRAQRLAHTIKGSSNVTGVPAVATLMHACEDLLESLYERQAQPDRRLAEVLIESADCLAAQLDYLQGAGPAPEQTAALVDTLRTWQIGAGDEPEPAVSPEPSALADADVPEPARQTAEQGTPESMRVSTALIEELLRQAGEVSISTVQLQG
ncbi:MAG TPA: Hpt domain-containing protein, partial [Arenicellales bacterium]|nr:Hpt domain-containing protein [Arenicellales bacterium]